MGCFMLEFFYDLIDKLYYALIAAVTIGVFCWLLMIFVFGPYFILFYFKPELFDLLANSIFFQ